MKTIGNLYPVSHQLLNSLCLHNKLTYANTSEVSLDIHLIYLGNRKIDYRFKSCQLMFYFSQHAICLIILSFSVQMI